MLDAFAMLDALTSPPIGPLPRAQASVPPPPMGEATLAPQEHTRVWSHLLLAIALTAFAALAALFAMQRNAAGGERQFVVRTTAPPTTVPPTTTTSSSTTTTTTTSTTTTTTIPRARTAPTVPRRPASTPIQASSTHGAEQWRSLVAAYTDWPVDLMLRVIWCESGGDPTNVNPRSGAAGLFQLYPAPAGAFDPVTNVRLGHDKWLGGGMQPWVSSRGCWS